MECQCRLIVIRPESRISDVKIGLLSSRIVKTGGMTIRLRTVDVTKPPRTAKAIGLRNEVSASPSPRAIGNMPAPIAIVVMTTGRALLLQASTSAEKRSKP